MNAHDFKPGSVADPLPPLDPSWRKFTVESIQTIIGAYLTTANNRKPVPNDICFASRHVQIVLALADSMGIWDLPARDNLLATFQVYLQAALNAARGLHTAVSDSIISQLQARYPCLSAGMQYTNYQLLAKGSAELFVEYVEMLRSTCRRGTLASRSKQRLLCRLHENKPDSVEEMPVDRFEPFINAINARRPEIVQEPLFRPPNEPAVVEPIGPDRLNEILSLAAAYYPAREEEDPVPAATEEPGEDEENACPDKRLPPSPVSWRETNEFRSKFPPAIPADVELRLAQELSRLWNAQHEAALRATLQDLPFPPFQPQPPTV